MKKEIKLGTVLWLIAVLIVQASILWAQTSSTTTATRSLLDPASLNQKAPASYKVRFTTTQ